VAEEGERFGMKEKADVDKVLFRQRQQGTVGFLLFHEEFDIGDPVKAGQEFECPICGIQTTTTTTSWWRRPIGQTWWVKLVPFMILLGPYLDRSYMAAGKISGRFISNANWMIRIG
jgi:hypothetical protein